LVPQTVRIVPDIPALTGALSQAVAGAETRSELL
jgi:hypothetical protein